MCLPIAATASKLEAFAIDKRVVATVDMAGWLISNA